MKPTVICMTYLFYSCPASYFATIVLSMESKGEVVNNLVRTLLQHCTLAHSATPAPFLRVPEATEGCKAAGKQYWSTLLVQPDKTCRYFLIAAQIVHFISSHMDVLHVARLNYLRFTATSPASARLFITQDCVLSKCPGVNLDPTCLIIESHCGRKCGYT